MFSMTSFEEYPLALQEMRVRFGREGGARTGHSEERSEAGTLTKTERRRDQPTSSLPGYRHPRPNYSG